VDEAVQLASACRGVQPRPATLVAGRRDRVVGYLDTFDALDRYPNASYHALDDAGHYLPFERPETLAGLVRDWLTRSTRSSPAG